MNYLSLIKILTSWASKRGEFELLYHLYNFYSIGIPNKLLYQFPNKGVVHISQIRNSIDVIHHDIFLDKLSSCFKKSKYCKLKFWDNSYGFNKY